MSSKQPFFTDDCPYARWVSSDEEESDVEGEDDEAEGDVPGPSAAGAKKSDEERAKANKGMNNMFRLIFVLYSNSC